MIYRIVKNEKLGKDGKTYTNLVLEFVSDKGVEFSTPIKPSFDMTSKAYSKYCYCINETFKEVK